MWEVGMMRRTLLILFVFAVVVASCDEGGDSESPDAEGSAAAATGSTATRSPSPSPTAELRTDFDIPPWSELVSMYEYDTSEPLGYQVVSRDRHRGVTMFDVTYRSLGDVVSAKLVLPDGAGPFPVVLYVPANDSGLEFFILDAIAMARTGYAGLLIESPARREPYDCFYCWHAASDTKAFVGYVVDLRRALDLLATLPQVDRERVGLVGHAVGGVVGGILAGVDDRIDAYVLQVAEGYWTDWARIDGPSGEELVRYQDRVAVLNPVNYVGHSQHASFLFQGVKNIPFNVTVANFRAFFDAAPEPKWLRWYEGDVWLGCPSGGMVDCDPSLPVFAEHRAWLQENV
jgi:hypothetical protein